MTHRFPASVYGHGEEPDPRFSLANERTFLAWVRTSLALFAAGVALEALDVPIRSDLRAVTAGVLVTLGLLAAIQGWVGWMNTERSLRERRALPGPNLAVALSTGVCVAILLIAVGSIL